MVGIKGMLVLGLVCFAAVATGQQMIDQSTLESEAEAASATGSYVVNGTGVVYDPNTITFFLNGTAVGTVPNPKAPGPSMMDHTDLALPPKDDKLPLDDKQMTTPSPTADDGDIFETLKSEIQNPLYNVIIGRKLQR